ncbi:MAG: flavin reductase family protein [Methanomicrobiales archaeon]|nr:flavin reductase family protein [Methanomicrobiales archaeon]
MKVSVGAKTTLYPDPVIVVGTYDSHGRPNAMVAAWGGICCSAPPCIAVSLRPATFTYRNITEQNAFTVNIPSVKYLREVDFFGTTSGIDTDKFAVTRLTPVKSSLVNAPYVEEFPIVMECRLLQTVNIGMHTQFIGEILDTKVDEAVMGADRKPDVTKIQPFCYDAFRQEYYCTGTAIGKAFFEGKKIKTPPDHRRTPDHP